MSSQPSEKYTFGSQKAASMMREIMERTATGVVNRLRPADRIGQVHHYDAGRQLVWVMFKGETEDNLVRARCSASRIPTMGYDIYGDSCDIVRVSGRPGDYWIADFVRGNPRVPGLTPGMLMRYGGIDTPEGWLECHGDEAQQALYPELYANIGDNYGSASAGNFKLPLFHKIYDDVDPINSNLFTANAGWAIDSQELRVRNSMVYCVVIFHATALISLSNVDHADQVALGPGSNLTNFVPDVQANAFAAGAVRVGCLTVGGNIRVQAGVIGNVTGGTLAGDIASGDTFNFTFFYPMPDDVAAVHGERMLIKT
jgi:hypothetical protein